MGTPPVCGRRCGAPWRLGRCGTYVCAGVAATNTDDIWFLNCQYLFSQLQPDVVGISRSFVVQQSSPRFSLRTQSGDRPGREGGTRAPGAASCPRKDFASWASRPPVDAPRGPGQRGGEQRGLVRSGHRWGAMCTPGGGTLSRSVASGAVRLVQEAGGVRAEGRGVMSQRPHASCPLWRTRQPSEQPARPSLPATHSETDRPGARDLDPSCGGLRRGRPAQDVTVTIAGGDWRPGTAL